MGFVNYGQEITLVKMGDLRGPLAKLNAAQAKDFADWLQEIDKRLATK